VFLHFISIFTHIKDLSLFCSLKFSTVDQKRKKKDFLSRSEKKMT